MNIVEIARDCIGTPYIHQGRIKGVALDCAGIPVHIAKTLNLEFNDSVGYPRMPFDGMLKKILDSQKCLIQVSYSELLSGDILLMRITKQPQHLAIFTGDTIIHASFECGKVVEQSFIKKHADATRAVYRFIK